MLRIGQDGCVRRGTACKKIRKTKLGEPHRITGSALVVDENEAESRSLLEMIILSVCESQEKGAVILSFQVAPVPRALIQTPYKEKCAAHLVKETRKGMDRHCSSQQVRSDHDRRGGQQCHGPELS